MSCVAKEMTIKPKVPTKEVTITTRCRILVEYFSIRIAAGTRRRDPSRFGAATITTEATSLLLRMEMCGCFVLVPVEFVLVPVEFSP